MGGSTVDWPLKTNKLPLLENEFSSEMAGNSVLKPDERAKDFSSSPLQISQPWLLDNALRIFLRLSNSSVVAYDRNYS